MEKVKMVYKNEAPFMVLRVLKVHDGTALCQLESNDFGVEVMLKRQDYDDLLARGFLKENEDGVKQSKKFVDLPYVD